jgi:putative copper resistance protein D
VWAAAALALVPVSVSDLVGQDAANPAAALNPKILLGALSIAELPPRGYLITAGIALLIGVLGRTVLRPQPAAGLLVLAVAGFLPLALSGHASSNGDHDVAVDTMIFHLVGISVWIGGLLALLGLARQRVARLDVVGRRYSGVALIAFALVAVSGMGNTWVRLDSPAALLTTAYGRLILIKASLLVALGVFGYLHRRRTLPGIQRGDHRAFIRLATVEVVVMATTVGVAVALGRTAPPPSGVPSPVAQTLGFDLAGPPTAWLLLADWRFDYLLGAAAIVAAGMYLTGVRRLHRRGDRWPAGRTVAWLLGCLLVVIATSSGLGRYAPSQFSIHMLAHMILGMCAPIMLALGNRKKKQNQNMKE